MYIAYESAIHMIACINMLTCARMPVCVHMPVCVRILTFIQCLSIPTCCRHLFGAKTLCTCSDQHSREYFVLGSTFAGIFCAQDAPHLRASHIACLAPRFDHIIARRRRDRHAVLAHPVQRNHGTCSLRRVCFCRARERVSHGSFRACMYVCVSMDECCEDHVLPARETWFACTCAHIGCSCVVYVSRESESSADWKES